MDRSTVKVFVRAEDGVTAIEYALIAGIVALAIVFSLTQIRGTLQTDLNSVTSGFSNAN